jgi:hypothetical protein
VRPEDEPRFTTGIRSSRSYRSLWSLLVVVAMTSFDSVMWSSTLTRLASGNFARRLRRTAPEHLTDHRIARPRGPDSANQQDLVWVIAVRGRQRPDNMSGSQKQPVATVVGDLQPVGPDTEGPAVLVNPGGIDPAARRNCQLPHALAAGSGSSTA